MDRSHHGDTSRSQSESPLLTAGNGTDALQATSSDEMALGKSASMLSANASVSASAGTGAASSSDGANSRQASLAACTAVLAKTILGAGMLGLPHALAESGYILGLVLLSGAAIASAFALHLLSVSTKTVGMWPSSFYVVTSAAIPRATMLIDLAVAIKCFGVGVSYLVVIGDLIPEAIRTIAPNAPDFIFDRRVWIGLYMLFIIMPLACLRTLNALRFTAAAGIGFVIFLVGVVTLYATVPSLDPCGKPNPDDLQRIADGLTDATHWCRGPTVWAKLDMGTCKILAIFIFGFTCHQNIFSACNELRGFNIPRINRVIQGCILLCWTMYALIALMAYHTYGSNVKSDVLQSFPPNMTLAVARILIATNCAFCFPLQSHPCRTSISMIIHQIQQWRKMKRIQRHHYTLAKDIDADTEKKHEIEPHVPSTRRLRVLSVLICLLSISVAMAVSDLGTVLAVVGATGSTTISYILPGAIFLKLHPGWTNKHYGAAALLIVGCMTIPSCLTFIFV